MKARIVFVSLIFLIQGVSFGRQLNLPQKKMLRDSLDYIIKHYTQYGNLKSDNALYFRKLFTDDALVFDDINPNLKGKKKLKGVESSKPIDQYISDILRVFGGGLSRVSIVETNLGKALTSDVLTVLENNKGQTTVKVTKEVRGTVNQGNYKGEFSNRPELSMSFQFILIENGITELKITGVEKISSSLKFRKDGSSPSKLGRIRWQFTANAALRTSKTKFQNVQDGIVLSDKGVIELFHESERILPRLELNAGVEAIHIIAKKRWEHAFSTGLSITQHSARISSERYENTRFQYTADQEQIPYYLTISGENLEENYKINFLNVPLRFRTEVTLSKWSKNSDWRKSVFLHPAILPALAIGGRSDLQGNIQLTAYFPEYGVTIEENEQLGLDIDPEISDFRNEFDLALVNFGVEVPFGMSFTNIRSGVQFYASAIFRSYLSSPIKEKGFLLIDDQGKSGIASLADKVNFMSVGFQFGFRLNVGNEAKVVKMRK